MNNFILICLEISKKTHLTTNYQKQIDNLNSPMSIRETYSIIEFFPQRKLQIQMTSLVDFFQVFKEDIANRLHQNSEK